MSLRTHARASRPAETLEQEVMLGEEIGQPPRRRRHDAELASGRQFRAVG